MSVSGRFTLGWLDDASTVIVNVYPTAVIAAKLLGDTPLVALLSLPPAFSATWLADALLEAVVGLDAAFAATVGPDATLQATIEPGSGFTAILSCGE